MSIKVTNKLIYITNINMLSSTKCVKKQQTAQSEASVSQNIPLSTTHVINKVIR